jgi:hypothetical protein
MEKGGQDEKWVSSQLFNFPNMQRIQIKLLTYNEKYEYTIHNVNKLLFIIFKKGYTKIQHPMAIFC